MSRVLPREPGLPTVPEIPGLPELSDLPGFPGLPVPPEDAPPSGGGDLPTDPDTAPPGAGSPDGNPGQGDAGATAEGALHLGTDFPTYTGTGQKLTARGASSADVSAPVAGPFRGGFVGGTLVPASADAGSPRHIDAPGCAFLAGVAAARLPRGAIATDQARPVRDRHRDILEFPG